MYPVIWSKIMHNGLTISSSLQPIKYLKLQSLYLNLSGTTIWPVVSQCKPISCLDLWNYFLLTLILSNFSVFSLILILRKNKTHSFCNASFLYWISYWYLFLWYSLILSFSSFDKFLYWFLNFFFIASLLLR